MTLIPITMAYGKNIAVTPESETNSFDAAFLQGLSPEVLAEQERILENIRGAKARVERKHSEDSQSDSDDTTFSPEVIAEQEGILRQIERQKARGGRLAGTQTMERVQLSIRNAVFC